jgi:8-oxo-dGTP diphosphatase
MSTEQSRSSSRLAYHEYDSRLGAYALLLRPGASGEDELLLALWNEGPEKRWTLPGGGVELDETPAEAAVREVREESGYQIELTGLLAIDTIVIQPHERQPGTQRMLRAIRVLYGGHVIGGELTAEVDGSTDEARWFPLPEIVNLPRVGLVDVALGVLREQGSSSVARQ